MPLGLGRNRFKAIKVPILASHFIKHEHLLLEVFSLHTFHFPLRFDWSFHFHGLSRGHLLRRGCGTLSLKATQSDQETLVPNIGWWLGLCHNNQKTYHYALLYCTSTFLYNSWKKINYLPIPIFPFLFSFHAWTLLFCRAKSPKRKSAQRVESPAERASREAAAPPRVFSTTGVFASKKPWV